MTLRVEALETENISVDAGTVILEGMNSRYEYELGSDSVEITVRGLAEDLDRLRTEGVEAYANVSGLGFQPGRFLRAGGQRSADDKCFRRRRNCRRKYQRRGRSGGGGRSECRCRQCVRTDRRCDRLKLTGEERKPW